MGTRGFTGLVIDGQEKLGYQQYDSYPSGVGVVVLKELKELVKDMTAFRKKARELELVTDKVPPTQKQIEKCSRYLDLDVSTQSSQDWYCLLRGTQGSLRKILSSRYVLDSSEFPLDSLSCEYGYLVDLDGGTFQVYEGYQKDFPKHGRWSGLSMKNSEFRAVELLAEWTLDALPTEKDFLARTEHEEKE